jgi:hypothetical protein
MTTFDEILPKLVKIFQPHSAEIQRIAPVSLVQRGMSLNGSCISNQK